MSTATKWLLSILVVFNLFLAALMSLLYGYRVSYKQELQQTKQELSNLEEQKDTKISQLEARRDALQTKVENLNDNLNLKEQELQSTSQELESERSELANLRSRINDLTTQVETLQDEKAQVQTKNENLQETIESKNQRISQLEDQKSKISTQLSEVEANLRQKQVSLSELQERFVSTKTELQDVERHLSKYQEQYGTIEAGETAPAVEGNVRAVNPDRNIVLINLGTKDGVKKGMRFSVIRGDRYISEIEVVESYDKWAAARSISRYQKRSPEVGDVVTTISPAPGGGDEQGTTNISDRTENQGTETNVSTTNTTSK